VNESLGSDDICSPEFFNLGHDGELQLDVAEGPLMLGYVQELLLSDFPIFEDVDGVLAVAIGTER
jgi:hypothetical protein